MAHEHRKPHIDSELIMTGPDGRFMGKSQEQWLSVEAEVRAPLATAQLVQHHVANPSDLVMIDRESYWLDMCLTPRPFSRVCYRNHWVRHRFERLGRVYLLPPGEEVLVRADGGVDHQSIFCRIRPEPLRDWMDGRLQWSDRRLKASLDIADRKILSLLMWLVEEMRHPGLASELLIDSITVQLVIELGRYFLDFDEPPVRRELAPWRLRLIDERLREGLDDPPSLTELATLCQLSVRQLTRAFRFSRGCTLGQYIVNSRIEHAKRMLGEEQPVKAVAYSLGFSSPSAFCFAFRRATGMTPGEFRASSVRRRISH